MSLFHITTLITIHETVGVQGEKSGKDFSNSLLKDSLKSWKKTKQNPAIHLIVQSFIKAGGSCWQMLEKLKEVSNYR